MNTEYILDQIKSILENNLSTEIDTIEIESSTSTDTPEPAEFKLGEFVDPDILTMFPSVCLYSPGSQNKNDYQNFQNREININILCWISENDVENLHRFLSRYSDAIQRVLRNEDHYDALGIHNQVIQKAENTDLYKKDLGYTQGLLIQMTIDYLMT